MSFEQDPKVQFTAVRYNISKGANMTTKKYILTFIVFFLLLAATPILFFCGLSLKEDSITSFYVLVTVACVSLISAITFIAINYKKLVAYDSVKIKNKIQNLDFATIEYSVTANELIEKLKTRGYAKIAENIFHRKIEDDVGDGIVVSHYYAALLQINTTVDIATLLEQFSKGMTTYNIGYIFIKENIDHNLDVLKNYIKETVVDVETYRYRYNNFFAPIIITDEKIYYLKVGSFISEYKHGVVEGLRVLGCDG